MYRLTPLGITSVTIDALFYKLLESEWALYRRAPECPEGAVRDEVGSFEQDDADKPVASPGMGTNQDSDTQEVRPRSDFF
jgi:hypothetical protein